MNFCLDVLIYDFFRDWKQIFQVSVYVGQILLIRVRDRIVEKVKQAFLL